MNAVIKLLTESEETPEFSDFYTEPTGTWMEQLVRFLLERGFDLIFTRHYYGYKFGDRSREIYELIKDNARWTLSNNKSSERYLFELNLPRKSKSEIYLAFSMYIIYNNYQESYYEILRHIECIDEKSSITKKVEFMKRLVEKTIALANEIRPTGNFYKLKDDLAEYKKALYRELSES